MDGNTSDFQRKHPGRFDAIFCHEQPAVMPLDLGQVQQVAKFIACRGAPPLLPTAGRSGSDMHCMLTLGTMMTGQLALPAPEHTQSAFPRSPSASDLSRAGSLLGITPKKRARGAELSDAPSPQGALFSLSGGRAVKGCTGAGGAAAVASP